MSWLIIAVFSYLIIAVQFVLDKFLLSSGKVSHPSVYAFYSGILSLGALIFSPLGFHAIGMTEFVQNILAGMMFTYGILLIFFAIQKSEVSKVAPVVGAVIPATTYIFSLVFLRETLDYPQMVGTMMLIAGGLLISFDLPFQEDKKKFFSGFQYSFLAGIVLGMAFSFFKYLFERDNFINVFSWTRIGLFFGALSLLVSPDWRRMILNSLLGARKPQKEHYHAGGLFVGNKILGGIGSAMVNYAISIGSVTVVNALVSIEYVFVFIISLVFSSRYPKIFSERYNLGDIVQKVAAIAIITAGIILISDNFRIGL